MKIKKIYLTLLIIFFVALLFSRQTVFADSGYQAEKVSQSHAGIIELESNQSSEFWVKFKNIGEKSWQGRGSESVYLRTVSGMKSKITHSSWYEYYIPNRVNPITTIYQGEEALFRFSIKGPYQPGIHWEKFQLYAGQTPIQGGLIEIAVKSTSVESPSNSESLPEEEIILPEVEEEVIEEIEVEETWWEEIPADINIVNSYRWPNNSQGPTIDVGLIYIEEEEKNDYLPLTISTKNQQLYNIYDQNNKLLIRNTAGESIKIDYDYDLGYYFISDNENKRLLMTDSYLILKMSNPGIFKINSWHNGPFWGQNVNDNEFRGSLKIHFNPNTQRLWIINQLPLEEYLKGVVEVGDSANQEFLKAQMIASRTYALFRYLTPKYTNTPDNQNFFTVRATQADQVYRGYLGEIRTPNANLAAEQTKGVIATYQGDPILAYYFAQSDGHTKDSHSVYMTASPVDYLKGKNDPPGQGKDLLGHGVGLPQISGIVAANQGANYSQILKYYYTGINLTKMY